MSDTLTNNITEQLKAARSEDDRIAGTFKVDEKGRFDISSEQNRDYVAAVNRAKEIKSVLDSAAEHQTIGDYLAAPETPSVAAGDVVNHGMEGKSLADLVIESESFQRGKAAGWSDMAIKSFSAEFEGKSIFNLSAGSITTQALGKPQDLGFFEAAKRKTHIRDLFPKSSTRAPILYGVRETGFVNNAAIVKQRRAADEVSAPAGTATDVFGRAPKSTIELQPMLFPVAEIAHLLDAHKNILSDEPRLRTFLNTRMQDGVKYEEDYELLYGVGGAEAITGLFNTPGIQNYTGLSSDEFSIQIRRAVTRAMLAEYEPTGIVLSVNVWEALEVEQTKDGAFRLSVSAAVGAKKQVWNLDVVATTAMTDDTALIGAFGMGAQLHDRETVKVSVSTEHGDNYARGVVTLRADERVALEVARPESFVALTWTTPAAPAPTV